jgi:hypothetical protein
MLTANVLREKFKQNLEMLERITLSPAERILKRLAWQKKIPVFHLITSNMNMSGTSDLSMEDSVDLSNTAFNNLIKL